MESLEPTADSGSQRCKICGARSTVFDQAQLLRKYRVQYFRCSSCGFIQTEEPYWLAEAYSAAIASQDVGIMQRNLMNAEVTTAVLNLLFPKTSRAVDYGAGHGIFVRLMRDKGFNFYWSDRYANNDYARGFEADTTSKYDFLTAFELLEHLTDPADEVAELMDLADNVLVSTCVVPNPAPRLSEWWYYVPTTGQHVSFYTPEALQSLARRFGRNLVSSGQYHLFTKRPQSPIRFRIATHFKASKAVNALNRRASLTQHDFQRMTLG